MFNALQSAYTRIMSTIPREILEIVFESQRHQTTLDQRIFDLVIKPRVKNDMSIYGGKILTFTLESCWSEQISTPSSYVFGYLGNYSVFRIPPEIREGRDLSCIMSVSHPWPISTQGLNNSTGISSTRGLTLGGLANAALENQTYAQHMTAPLGRLAPGNILILDPPQTGYVPWTIRGRLMFDDDFSGLDSSSIISFSRVCEYAVKAYIYTNLVIPIDRNFVERGMEIGTVRSIIEGFADANQQYDEILMREFSVDQLADPNRLPSIIYAALSVK